MRIKCIYNEKRDLMRVVPDLAIDLASAIEHGVVLDTGTIVEHNEISDPTSIAGRVRDCFDAFEAQRAIKAAAKSAAKSSQSEPAVSAGTGASVQSTPAGE